MAPVCTRSSPTPCTRTYFHVATDSSSLRRMCSCMKSCRRTTPTGARGELRLLPPRRVPAPRPAPRRRDRQAVVTGCAVLGSAVGPGFESFATVA
eukprot:scaffold24789_cov122-Isochrysis_galbana.AAC.1